MCAEIFLLSEESELILGSLIWEVSLSSCPYSRQLYRLEGLHLRRCPTTAAVLKDAINVTLLSFSAQLRALLLVKRQEWEPNHKPPSNAEVKNVFKTQCLIKHGKNVTSYFAQSRSSTFSIKRASATLFLGIRRPERKGVHYLMCSMKL
jgi:hypothetical protein